MAFHLRTVAEWIQGDHRKRDWPASFEPQSVYDSEWKAIQQELEDARVLFLEVMESLTPETFAKEGAGYGAIAHLAYHLGAIRQLLHDGRSRADSTDVQKPQATRTRFRACAGTRGSGVRMPSRLSGSVAATSSAGIDRRSHGRGSAARAVRLRGGEPIERLDARLVRDAPKPPHQIDRFGQRVLLARESLNEAAATDLAP
jgi:hypothetical protein